MKKLLVSLLAVAYILPTMSISAASVKINSTNFPDKNFRNVIKDKLDKNDDGYLSSSEINAATILHAYDRNIESAEGIKYLKNLETLYLNDNPLEELDLRYNTKITRNVLTVAPNNLEIRKNIAPVL